MEICIVYMENNINCILFDTVTLPLLTDCDILTASDNFYHMDRTADFNVLIYVTDGVMYVTEDEQDYEIAAGEMLFLRSGLRHYGKRETLRGTRWFYAHFYLPAVPADSIDKLKLPKKISGLRGSVLEEKINELCRYFHSTDTLISFRKNVMLYELLLETCVDEVQQGICGKICAYLDMQTDKPFTKELVEKKFFLSYSHMAAVFRKEQGMSMGEYHNRARMKKACHLLRSTLLPVSEIADLLGFADMLYFSRKFHAFAGVSPTDYRKQIQQKY